MENVTYYALEFLREFIKRELGQLEPPKVWTIEMESGKYFVESDPHWGNDGNTIPREDTAMVQNACLEFDPFNHKFIAGPPDGHSAWCPESLPPFEAELTRELRLNFIMSSIKKKDEKRMAVGMGWQEDSFKDLLRTGTIIPELPGGLLFELLSRACHSYLTMRLTPNSYYSDEYPDWADYAKSEAVETYIKNLLGHLGWSKYESSLYHRMVELATSSYESKMTNGIIRLLNIAETSNPLIELENKPLLSQRAMVRKLFEIGRSMDNECLAPCIFNSRVHSLQRFDPKSDLHVLFSGDLSWFLKKGDRWILAYLDGILRYPMPKGSLSVITSVLRAEFPDDESFQIASLIHEALSDTEHGGLVVFMDRPEADCERLCPPGVRIRHGEIVDTASIQSLTRPDGAVIVDTKGIVHAIGVILDGPAMVERADPSRGARYHSALRFMSTLSTQNRRAIAFLKSEDRGLELVTKLANVIPSALQTDGMTSGEDEEE